MNNNEIFNEGKPQLDPRLSGVSPEPMLEEDQPQPFTQRLGHVSDAFKDDWNSAGNLGRSVQVAAIAGQVVERLRVSEIIVAPTAVHILQSTGNPTLTSLAVLGMVGSMQGAISHTWAESMDKSPQTVEAINDGFPKLVEYAEDLGPAKEKRWYSHFREGASTFLSYGVTPFVVSEKVNNPDMSRGDLHKTAAKLTGKCALFGFGFAFAVSEVAVNSNEEAASTILNVLEKPYVWIGIAAVFEVPRLVGKRIQRHKNKKSLDSKGI